LLLVSFSLIGVLSCRLYCFGRRSGAFGVVVVASGAVFVDWGLVVAASCIVVMASRVVFVAWGIVVVAPCIVVIVASCVVFLLLGASQWPLLESSLLDASCIIVVVSSRVVFVALGVVVVPFGVVVVALGVVVVRECGIPIKVFAWKHLCASSQP
jgi:hypothetical protein